MTVRLFGTDGIRGRANVFPITPDVMVRVGQAVAHIFQAPSVLEAKADSTLQDNPLNQGQTLGDNFNPYVDPAHPHHRLTVVVGKDTRLSGYMIESALVAGLVSHGAHVIMLGPLPTPAVAMLTRSLRADVGIMISASHNPYKDNGIKFFDANGVKLTGSTEAQIEKLVHEGLPCPLGECGKSMRLDDAAGRYIEFAKATFPKGQSLAGLSMVLDCANGAAYKVAPRIFWELGASVRTLGDQPNGRNINESCGALHPEKLRQVVVETHADVGIALDGDADRLLLMTPKGQVVSGDQILALMAREWSRRGCLTGGVVSTVMSNAGLRKYLESHGVNHFEADVGDKHVVELMQQTNSNLGGEESGHLIFGDATTTGDGIIAALQVLSFLRPQGPTLDDLFPVFQPLPQVKFSLPRTDTMTPEWVAELQAQTERFLPKDSRLLIRRSGTEPVLRVLLQGEDEKALREAWERAFREMAHTT